MRSTASFGGDLPHLVDFEARRRKMMRRQRAWLSAIMALLLVLAAMPIGFSLLPGAAQASQTVQLSVGDFIYYDGARTCPMTVDGSMAYCMDPQLPTPPPGSYQAVDELTPANPANKSTLRAAVWFSYGGPGFDKSMWPEKWFDGTAMTNDRYVVLGHLLVSQLFTSSEKHATAGCSEEFVLWAKQEVLGYDKGEVTNPSASRFKVEAGRKQVPDSFRAFQIPTGAGTQTLISFAYNPVGAIELQKVSAAPGLTEGNPLYQLAGAEYGVFSDSACSKRAATLTTDASGFAQVEDLPVGTYYVKELANPAGFGLDEAVYTVTVKDGETTAVNGGTVQDEPFRNPVDMLVLKRDAQFSVADPGPQGDGSLAGAEFTVRHYGGLYDSAASAEASGKPLATWVFATDEAGVARFSDDALVSGPALYRDGAGTRALALGTYLVQETKAPAGYQLNDRIMMATVSPQGALVELDQFVPFEQPETVLRGGIALQKVDAETETGTPLGRATLEGTQFQIKNVSAGDVIVAGERYTPGSVVATIACDGEGRAATAPDLLPFGTYEVFETQPSLGYLFGGSQTKTVAIRSEGLVSVDVAGDPLRFKNEVIRGDLEFVKVREGDQERLSGIPFLITSLTTGEAHVVVTDENGQCKTEHRWNSHDVMTNKNDDALREDGTVDEALLDAAYGVWFGAFDEKMCAPNGRGALPFDRYSIQELPVPANENLELVFIPSVSITRDSVTVDMGTVTDGVIPGEPEPEIFTRARADNGTSVAPAAEQVTLTDRVSYGNLEPGATYHLTAQLVDRATGEFLYQDGQPLTSTKTFVPAASEGVEEISVALNTAALEEGAEVVFYETLAKGEEAEVVALHQDLSNSYQTVAVAHPLLRTTLAGPDGEKSLQLDGECRLVDAVEYEGLEPGRPYRLEGRLMLKTQKADGTVEASPLKDAAGNEVVAVAEFTPEKSGGTQEVEFAFDASHLEGSFEVVAFERLMHGEETVATHEDAADANQTVVLERPEPEPEPAPPLPLPKTGDDAGIFALLGIAATISSIALALSVRARRAGARRQPMHMSS